MGVKKEPPSQEEPVKVASLQRLVEKLESAYRNGTLKPINPAAKHFTQEVRVKKK